MMQDPLHTIGVLSAIRSQTPSLEVDFGPGKTDTKALESTKNSLSKKLSLRKRREEQQTSSGTIARTGASTGLEQGRQVGRDLPPAGLLVFQN